MWGPEAEGQITHLEPDRPVFPAEPLELFGPGTDSGTFDYFTDAINGEEGASRTDYTASEDDNVLVQGVEGATGRARLLRLHLLRGERQQAQGRRRSTAARAASRPARRPLQDGTYIPLVAAAVHLRNQGLCRGRRSRSSSTSTSQNDAEIAEAAQFVALNEEQRAALEAQSSG